MRFQSISVEDDKCFYYFLYNCMYLSMVVSSNSLFVGDFL